MANKAALSDKYRIIELLGAQKKRKFSTVYLVEDKFTSERFVMKVAQQNDLAIERLKAETSYSFNEKGLPKLAELHVTEENAIAILNYQKGISWTEHFRRIKRKKKVNELIRLIRLLEPLLRSIHEQGIVHLDIKPSNLLYDSESESVSILDFGLAIQLPYSEKRKILFPLGYAAPETLLNEMDLVDFRSDYFSLAISCYQLLEERLPLLHPNPSITTNLQLTHPLPDCSLLSKKGNEVLRKLGAKHQFATAPNLLSESDRKQHLTNGRNSRYDSLKTFLNELEETEKRTWKLF